MIIDTFTECERCEQRKMCGDATGGADSAWFLCEDCFSKEEVNRKECGAEIERKEKEDKELRIRGWDGKEYMKHGLLDDLTPAVFEYRGKNNGFAPIFANWYWDDQPIFIPRRPNSVVTIYGPSDLRAIEPITTYTEAKNTFGMTRDLFNYFSKFECKDFPLHYEDLPKEDRPKIRKQLENMNMENITKLIKIARGL